jgi:hypothetical protein
VAGLAFAAALVRSMAGGIGLADESWFLQVVARMRTGDALYRDVYLGVTPLSAYVTSLFTLVTGVDVLAEKLVTNLSFAATIWLAWRMAREVAGDGIAGLLAGVLLILARPSGSPPYTPLAVACFMATAAATLRWTGDDRRRDALIGLCAGLAFLAKQNVGLLALGAAGAVMALDSALPVASRLRALATVVGATVAIGACGLLPTWLAGGWPMFVDYGFAGKGAYLAFGRVSYLASLSEWLGSARHLWIPGAAGDLLHGLVLILPGIVLVAVLANWRRRGLDVNAWRLLTFAAAGTLIALPRWDRFHMAYAVPIHLVTLASLGGGRPGMTAPGSSRSSLALAAAFPAAVVVTLLPGLIAMDRGRLSLLPHFRGAVVTPAADAAMRTDVDRLTRAAGGRPTFVLDSRAGFLYLAAGLRNPTPFDVPAVMSVGRHGTDTLLRQFGDGSIDQVCVGIGPRGLYAFEPLVSFVTAHFQPGETVGLCRMYRARR